MAGEQAEGAAPDRVCPWCREAVPEHWWAMGICPGCNRSLRGSEAPAVPSGALEETPAAGEVRQQLVDVLAAAQRRQQLVDVLAAVQRSRAQEAGELPGLPQATAPPPMPDQAGPTPAALPAAQPVEVEPKKSRKGLIGILAAIGAALLKFKSVLLVALGKLKFLLPALKLLKFGKFLTTGGSMLLAAALYATIFGWPYAIGLVLLILVHELGHMLVMWRSGLPTTAPIFIPFFGAAIFWKQMPRDAKMEAAIAFGGPALGTVGALVCYGVYMLTAAPIWLALAYVGAFINLFNLLPVLPLDGGRIMAAVSPKVWLLGMVGMVLVFLKFHSPFLLLLALLSLPRMIGAFKRQADPGQERYYNVPRGTRALIAAAYFGLAGFLGYLMVYAFHTLG